MARQPTAKARDARQLAFDLPQRPAMDRDDFFVAPCNEEAVAWIDRWPDWRAPGLVVHGPTGCGKSHLCAVWASRAASAPVGEDDLLSGRAAELVGESAAVIVDDADRLAGVGPGLEEALFHLFNAVAGAGATILLTGRTPPSAWSFALADLASRIRALPAVAIGEPDDALIDALYVKQFADRQLRVAGDLVAYLRARTERSFDSVRRAVDLLDRAALAERREITIPFARATLNLDRKQGSE